MTSKSLSFINRTAVLGYLILRRRSEPCLHIRYLHHADTTIIRKTITTAVLASILALSVLTAISPITFAQTTHIVINEIEQNPAGTDSGNEWVELYNPTAGVVDVSGWALSTTHGNTITVTITSGIINPGNYLLVQPQSQWLDNDDESVILMDLQSQTIDLAPAQGYTMNDNDNDNWSWQRFPNGQDTDRLSDWTFAPSTKAQSNGGETTTTTTTIATTTTTATTTSQTTTATTTTTTTSTTTTTQTTTTTTAATTLASSITITFIDVGQGDSIYIDTPTDDVLIDGGPRNAGSKVVQFLTSQGVNRLDYVIATHADADHIGGLITVLQSGIRVGNIIWNGETRQTTTFQDWFSLASEHAMLLAARDQNYTLADGVWMLVLNPTQPLQFTESNDNSVMVKIQIGQTGFMLTGDCELDCETSVVGSGYNLESEVLKVGHHGSRTSTSTTFLSTVAPEVAVISAGLNNQYGHPHQEVIDLLLSRSITIYGTYQGGDISIIGYRNGLQIVGQPQPIPEFAEVFLPLIIALVMVLVVLKVKKLFNARTQPSTTYQIHISEAEPRESVADYPAHNNF